MAFPSKVAVVLLLQLFSSVKLVTSYCEWNTCKSWEHCCGDACCSNTDVTFYIYTFLCISGALLFLCCIVFYICRFFWHVGHPVIQMLFGNYNNLSRDVESSTTNLATGEVINDPPTYPDLPPSYSEVMNDRK